MDIVQLFIILQFCLIVNSKFVSHWNPGEGNQGFLDDSDAPKSRVKREVVSTYNEDSTFFDQNLDVDRTLIRASKTFIPRPVKDGCPVAPEKIRLRGDGVLNYNEGRVEVYDEKSKSWGMVCDDYWMMRDANVTCRELGFYNAAREATRNDRYGKGHWRDNDYTIQGVNCMGNEKSLLDCARHPTTFCSTKSAGVSCIFNRGCPDGWASFSGACYKVFTKPQSFQEADKMCQTNGAKLIYILSIKENNFLSNLLSTAHKSLTKVWSGGHYAEGVSDNGKLQPKWNWYSTIHNVAIWNTSGLWFPGFYDSRSDSRPEGDLKQRSCVGLSRTYSDSRRDNQIFDVNYFWWDNLSCKESLPFICQKNKPKTKSDCYEATGSDYRGRVSRTEQGSPCALWTDSRATVNPTTNPNAGLGDHHFCRNPDNDIKPWCWVNPIVGLYGYCDIGRCGELTTESTEPVSPPLSEVGFGKGNCKKEEFNCPSMVSYNRNCITKEHVCDRVINCNGKEDENPEFCRNHLCKQNEFFCPLDMYCILNNYVCDGKRNCRDGADEVNCTVIDESEILTQFDKFPNQSLYLKDQVLYFKISAVKCMQYCLTLYSQFPCKSFNFLPPNGTRDISECHLLLQSASEIPDQLVKITYSGDHYSMKTDCTGKFRCGRGLCVALDKKCNGQNDCGDGSDERNCSAVIYPPFEIRLVGSDNKWEGKVEVRYQGEWGFVCDDKFNINAANVVCRQLGYEGAVKAVQSAVKVYGKIRAPIILLDEVACNGTERSIEDCPHSSWRSHNCQPDEITGVVCKIDRACTTEEFRCFVDKQCIDMQKVCDGNKDCSDGSDEPTGRCDLKVDLVNGPDKKSGRIEVRRANSKGTVCDDGFDDNDAKVICGMVGIPGSAKAIKDGRYGPGTGRIVLGNLKCVGNETSLDKCPFYKWGGHSCSHKEDAGVICGATETETTSSPTTVATKAPAKEPKCGIKPIIQKRSRVVGGFQSLYGAFPWQVGIRMKVSDTDRHWCGGTILSEDWIISASHCYTKPKNEYRVRTGDWNNLVPDKYEQEFEIEELIIHPNWNSDSYDYDLTLIKVHRVNGQGIKFNDHVQPACLAKVGDKPDLKTKCFVSGWGDTLAEFSEVLLAAEVPLISRERCDDMYKNRLTDRMQCAGYEAGGIDTCQGDSGGPLVCKVKGLFTILGATSFGEGCGQPRSPGVYAKIEVMIGWIKQITGL